MKHLLKCLFRAYRPLWFSMLFCALLITGRVIYTGEITFVFLVWNLFLAFLPFVFSWRLKLERPGLLNLGKLLLCLLFLPNAPYILTDLFHLRTQTYDLIWFDTLLIANFAWCGLLFYFFSLRHLQKFMQPLFSKNFIAGALILLSMLNGFGIYIGRYLRFNSWDILTQPFALAREMAALILQPWVHPQAWGITVLYGIFLYLGYWQFSSIKKLPTGY